ncbi:hypothetical protein BC826DRAFT_1106592 [Russula brevipes]|nr:hypothetical protein BC826DRAFT_1106592 [Russula brevipes]
MVTGCRRRSNLSVSFAPTDGHLVLLTAHSSDTEPETEEPEEDAPSLPQYITISAVPVQLPNTNTNTRAPPSSKSQIYYRRSPHHTPTARQLHVHNLAFEKRVAARFTTDSWTTVSESLAQYTGLAPPAPGQGDGSGNIGSSTWVPLRVLHLPRAVRAPPQPGAAPRTSSPSVRFTAPGVGEWWDNNGGEDICVRARCEEGGGYGCGGGGASLLPGRGAVSGGGGGPPAELVPRRRSPF